MKKLINYLFPNDWYDVETINVTHHSSLTPSFSVKFFNFIEKLGVK